MTWTATEHGPDPALDLDDAAIVIQDGDEGVCWLYAPADDPAAIEQMRARARLIVQAEAMLAAAKEASINPCGEYYFGLHCGLEDRDITDRYEAADYGWEKAFEYVESVLSAIIKATGGENE